MIASRRFEDALELEREKPAQTIAGKLRAVDRTLLLEDTFRSSSRPAA
jgi:hypothetical protein